MINRISNIQMPQAIGRASNCGTKPQTRELSLLKGLSATDSVNFGNAKAKILIGEITNLAQNAKKIRFDEVTPKASDIFMEGNKYSIDEFPASPSILRIKRDIGGNGSNVTVIDTQEIGYEAINDALRAIAIPKILERKGFKGTNLTELMEEFKERLGLGTLKFIDNHTVVQDGQKVKKSAYWLKSDNRNSSVNFVQDAQNNPPTFYRVELVDNNGYYNSFHLKKDQEIELVKPFIQK